MTLLYTLTLTKSVFVFAVHHYRKKNNIHDLRLIKIDEAICTLPSSQN